MSIKGVDVWELPADDEESGSIVSQDKDSSNEKDDSNGEVSKNSPLDEFKHNSQGRPDHRSVR